jgi:hypothetical protein
VLDISGLDMRKFEQVHLMSEATRSANVELAVSAQPITSLLEPQTFGVPNLQLPETGFLLDWLSGGEGLQRGIQGFPLRFESLT